MEPRNRKQKILYVITKSNFGGAQRYVFDLACAFSQTHEVVVALGPPAQPDEPSVLQEKLAAAGVRTVVVAALQRDIHITKEFRAFFALMRIIREERPDVLHVNSSKVGGLGALAGRLCRVPRIIFTAHGWEFNNPARGVLSRIFIAVLSWMTITLSHETIAVSSAMRAWVRHIPITRHKARVIHNGVAQIDFVEKEGARDALIERPPRLAGQKEAAWIGMLAELHPVKGIDIAIDALAALATAHPEAVLIVCGEGHERARLAQRIDEAGLAERVFLPGNIDAAARLVRAFDIFLFPSRSEGLGYALLEAGAAGLPIIASRVGGIPEVVEDKKTGVLVPPGDAAALADALDALLNAPEVAREYGAAIARRVVEDFSHEGMLAKTAAVYRGSATER